VGPGRYCLYAKADTKSGPAQKVFEFDIEGAAISGPGIAGVGDISGLVQSQVKSEVAALRAEFEKKELEAKIKDLEERLKEKNGWQTKAEFLIEKGTEAIMKHLSLNGNFQKAVATEPAAPDGKNPGISGMDQSEAEKLDERANAAFDTLIEKVGADLIPALEALAAKEPETLKQLLNYLK